MEWEGDLRGGDRPWQPAPGRLYSFGVRARFGNGDVQDPRLPRRIASTSAWTLPLVASTSGRVDGRRAVPVGERPAGLLDDRLGRGDVPRVDAVFDHQVGAPLRPPARSRRSRRSPRCRAFGWPVRWKRLLAAGPREPADAGVAQTSDSASVATSETRMRRSFRNAPSPRGRGRSCRKRGCSATPPICSPLYSRPIERGPDGDVPDERFGAVDGVDDPAEAARPGLVAVLLAEEAVVGEKLRRPARGSASRPLVGDGDRAACRPCARPRRSFRSRLAGQRSPAVARGFHGQVVARFASPHSWSDSHGESQQQTRRRGRVGLGVGGAADDAGVVAQGGRDAADAASRRRAACTAGRSPRCAR